MKLNKSQQKRIKRAVRIAEWNYRQKQGNASSNNKTPDNGLRTVYLEGIT